MPADLVRRVDRPLPQAIAWLSFAAFWLVLCALMAWEVAFDHSAFR